MIDILILLLGLGLILVGANALTDGASAVAKRFGISDLVIGLTIVAMGTSAPELVVSVTAALNDSAELALGNVVGSNVFNILAIVGCTAMVMPISTGSNLPLPFQSMAGLLWYLWLHDTAKGLRMSGQ